MLKFDLFLLNLIKIKAILYTNKRTNVYFLRIRIIFINLYSFIYIFIYIYTYKNNKSNILFFNLPYNKHIENIFRIEIIIHLH